ncbi:MAG: glycosyltransferase family 39 protein [Lachnospiraceae bacterium]|nr:glycosyltransferase family 39 protein [Lachnospiraceae bacterium]
MHERKKAVYEKGNWEQALTAAFRGICMLLFAVLSGCSMLLTGYNKDTSYEMIFFREDSPAGNLAGLFAALVLVFGTVFLWRCLRQKLRIKMDTMALFVSILMGAVSVWWVVSTNTAPRDDQALLCSYARFFNEGDFSGLGRGEYVGIYRQQLGMITLLRVLFFFFGAGNYRSFQYLSAVLAGFLVYFGYRIVRELAGEEQTAGMIYLLLMLCCIPMYVYVPFVYGDLISCVFLFLAAWMLLSGLREFSWKKAMVCGLAAGLSVQLRQNCLIVIIAFALVLLIKLLSIRKREALILFCSLMAGVLLTGGMVSAIYHDKIPEDSESMPVLLHIAMGTMWDRENPGWYDFYNLETFETAGYDAAAASEAARETIRDFVVSSVENPAYAADFYYNKMIAQWEAPMYQCLVMNNVIVGEQGRIAASLYRGRLSQLAEAFMNIFQLLVYGAILILLFFKRKEWCGIEKYVLLIAVFGGFLFSMIWEAKTRYVLPYMLCMIPYAAVGLAGLPAEKITAKLPVRKNFAGASDNRLSAKSAKE